MNDFIAPERPRTKLNNRAATLPVVEPESHRMYTDWTLVYVGIFLLTLIATAFVFIYTDPSERATNLFNYPSTNVTQNVGSPPSTMQSVPK